jgi:hypothetical protein
VSFSLLFLLIYYFSLPKQLRGRSQCPRGLRHRIAAARLRRLWVRIRPGAWMSVCYESCALSGRGLCDGLITRPEESYRMWCVIVCDPEISWMRRPWLTVGRRLPPPPKKYFQNDRGEGGHFLFLPRIQNDLITLLFKGNQLILHSVLKLELMFNTVNLSMQFPYTLSMSECTPQYFNSMSAHPISEPGLYPLLYSEEKHYYQMLGCYIFRKSNNSLVL